MHKFICLSIRKITVFCWAHMYFSFGIFLVSRLSKVILQWEMIGKGKSCRENERE